MLAELDGVRDELTGASGRCLRLSSSSGQKHHSTIPSSRALPHRVLDNMLHTLKRSGKLYSLLRNFSVLTCQRVRVEEILGLFTFGDSKQQFNDTPSSSGMNPRQLKRALIETKSHQANEEIQALVRSSPLSPFCCKVDCSQAYDLARIPTLTAPPCPLRQIKPRAKEPLFLHSANYSGATFRTLVRLFISLSKSACVCISVPFCRVVTLPYFAPVTMKCGIHIRTVTRIA